MGSLLWKVLGTGSAVLAAMAARNIIETGWTAATGKNPPKQPESPDTELWEAVGWAVASGAVAGLARMIATREAANVYRAAVGDLPKDVKKPRSKHPSSK